jgi:hypothetical protein
MRHLVFMLAIVVGLAGTAAAQDMAWSTIIPSVAGTDVLGLHLRELMQRSQQATGNAQHPTEPSTAPVSADLRFTPSKERRAANISAFVAQSRRLNQQEADRLAALFASTDVFGQMEATLAGVGLRIDDVSDVYALWCITAWSAVRGRNDTPSRMMAMAVKAQIAQAISSSGTLRGANDAVKQELAESLLLKAALIDAIVEKAKSNPEQLKTVQAAMIRAGQGMGFDLAGMNLTDHGFIPLH